MSDGFRIRVAVEEDVPLIVRFIRELAEYEKLLHECVATDERVRATLFGSPRFAEVLIVEESFPDASHVIPSEVEGPGRTGGAPPTPPGPSTSVGMTEVGGARPARLAAAVPAGAVIAERDAPRDPGGTPAAPSRPVTPAGFALFFHNYSTFLSRPGIYLEDLYVRPEFRGKGCGRALLVRLAEIARERDCGRLEWAVLTWNEPAIGFYKSLGARPLDEWVGFRLTGKELADLAVLSSPAPA